VDLTPIKVIELQALLRVGTETWVGLGAWEYPRQADLWPLLAEYVAMAFKRSAEVLLNNGSFTRFQLTGTAQEYKGTRAYSFRRQFGCLPADSPDRVTWLPQLPLNVGVDANGK